MVQEFQPLLQRRAQLGERDAGERGFRAAQVPQPAAEHGTRARIVLPRSMMKRNRQLDQSLEVPAQVAMVWSGTPGVLQRFMGFEKSAAIEEGQTAAKMVGSHRSSLSSSLQLGLQFSIFF